MNLCEKNLTDLFILSSFYIKWINLKSYLNQEE